MQKWLDQSEGWDFPRDIWGQPIRKGFAGGMVPLPSIKPAGAARVRLLWSSGKVGYFALCFGAETD